MDFRLSSLFHQASKRLPKVPLDPDRWPPEWKTTQFKAYERLPKIPLSRAELVAGRDYFDVVRARRSIRDFDDGKPLNNELLSTLLRYSCGLLEQEHGRSRRSHPSGGGLVPIEIYPLVFSGNATIPAGVYHYNIREHALDVLWHRSFGKDDVRNLFAYPWVEHASFAIVLTAVFERSQIKYGERGYRPRRSASSVAQWGVHAMSTSRSSSTSTALRSPSSTRWSSASELSINTCSVASYP